MILSTRPAEESTGRMIWLLANNGEKIVEGFLNCLDKSLFEVKFDQYRNGRMVVEVEQNPGGKGWKPSGLMTTKAKWWIYVFSPQAFIAVEVDRLKKYLQINDKMTKKEFARRFKQ